MEPLDLLAVVAHPDDAVQAGEAFPGGRRALEAQVRAHGAQVGSLGRVENGEPFWTRETVQVPSLGAPPVSTF